MTEEQIAWGAKEIEIRKTELAAADSEAAFRNVQARAKARRKAIGLSAGQAVAAIIESRERKKRESWNPKKEE